MIGFEIFNVFDVQNAITMTWVRDVTSKSQFGTANGLNQKGASSSGPLWGYFFEISAVWYFGGLG